LGYILSIFLMIFSYPYERVPMFPLELTGFSKPALKDYTNPLFASGIVFLPAGINSYSMLFQRGILAIDVAYLNSGEIQGTDIYGEPQGDFEFGILRGNISLCFDLDLIKCRFSINGMRASAPEFLKKSAWAGIEIHRPLYRFENLLLGALAGEQYLFYGELFGPYHTLRMDFVSSDEYTFSGALMYNLKNAGVLAGASFLKYFDSLQFVPFISIRLKYKKIVLHYTYRVQSELPDINGIVLSIE